MLGLGRFREEMMRSKILLALALGGVAPFACADMIQFDSVGLNQVESISGDGGSNFISAYTGELNFTDETTTTNYTTFCVDILDEIHSGSQWDSNLQLSNTLGNPAMDRAAAIISADFNSVHTNDEAAGLQLAVWDAIYDNGASFDADHGTFQAQNVSSSVLNYANQYYADRNGNGVALYFGTHTNQDGHVTGQAQMTPVPEPSTVAGILVGALALLRRRRSA